MKPKNRRIEPTFSSKQPQIEQHTYQHVTKPAPSSALDTLKQHIRSKAVALVNVIKSFWQKNKPNLLTANNIRIVAIAILLMVIISIAASFFTSKNSPLENNTAINNTAINNETKVTAADAYERNHKIIFPDNFSLYASQYNGLTIHWQGEITSLNNIWHIAKAQGDKNCQAIIFNNGEKYSVIDITVENSIDYFANFSPLDTNKIAKALAFRGNFTLCGYKFSLKGSQALLGKHGYYSELFSY